MNVFLSRKPGVRLRHCWLSSCNTDSELLSCHKHGTVHSTQYTVHKPRSIFKYPLPCRYVRVGLKVSQNMSCCGKYLTCWPHRPGEWRVVSRKWLQIVWRRQRAGDSFQFYKCSSETAGTAKPSVIDVRPTSRLNCFLNCVTNISKCEKVTILKSQFCSIASWSVQFYLTKWSSALDPVLYFDNWSVNWGSIKLITAPPAWTITGNS